MNWHFDPWVVYTCHTCQRELQLRIGEDPPKQCAHCGNSGQNLFYLSECCDEWMSANDLPEGWDYDVCPQCEGVQLDNVQYYSTHAFEWGAAMSPGFCAVCNETERHPIHFLDDEDDEMDDEARDE